MKPDPGTDTDRIAGALADGARGIVPSAVPLGRILLEGRRRRRRHRALLVGGGGLAGIGVLVPIVLLTGPVPERLSVEPSRSAASVGSGPVLPTVRVVAPGQPVRPWRTVRLWLTEEGAYWQADDDPDPIFRSAFDVNIDRSEPGISLVMGLGGDQEYFFGLYYGPGADGAATVVLSTPGGLTCTGSLVTLSRQSGWGASRQSGWGAWYADPRSAGWTDRDLRHMMVSILDAQGRTLTAIDLDQPFTTTTTPTGPVSPTGDPAPSSDAPISSGDPGP